MSEFPAPYTQYVKSVWFFWTFDSLNTHPVIAYWKFHGVCQPIPINILLTDWTSPGWYKIAFYHTSNVKICFGLYLSKRRCLIDNSHGVWPIPHKHVGFNFSRMHNESRWVWTHLIFKSLVLNFVRTRPAICIRNIGVAHANTHMSNLFVKHDRNAMKSSNDLRQPHVQTLAWTWCKHRPVQMH